MIALGGMLAIAVLGLCLAIAVWLVMRKSLVVLSIVIFAAIAFCFLLDYVLFRFGRGTIVTPLVVFFSAILLASLMGFIVLRIGGARLLTGVPEDSC